MSTRASFFYSLTLGFIFALFSTIPAISYPVNPSLSAKIAFWNISSAIYFIKAGLLASCENCELTVLLYVVIYSFLLGWLGYSIFVYAMILVFEMLKTRNRL